MKVKSNQDGSKKPINSLVFSSKEVEKLLVKAKELLIGEKAIHYIVNPNAKDRKQFRMKNSELFTAIKNKPLVYCIWEQSGKNRTKAYIGHSCASYSAERIINHFFKKDKRTGSVLEKVREALKNGKRIGFSFLTTEPSYMRYVLEDLLIKEYSNELKWNKNNKKASKR